MLVRLLSLKLLSVVCLMPCTLVIVKHFVDVVCYASNAFAGLFCWTTCIIALFVGLRRVIKCESANSTTYKVRNKVRKYCAADTELALVTGWFDIFIHILHNFSFRRFSLSVITPLCCVVICSFTPANILAWPVHCCT